MGDKNKLDLLPRKGRNNIINVDGEDIKLTCSVRSKLRSYYSWNSAILTSIGQNKDTLRREEQIERGLGEQFGVDVDGDLSAFFYGTLKKDSRFGSV